MKLDKFNTKDCSPKELLLLLKIGENNLKEEDLSETEKEVVLNFIKISKEKEDLYYFKNEKKRIDFIKKIGNATDESIYKTEILCKTELINKLLLFKDKEKFIKQFHNEINLRYLDRLREFFTLENMNKDIEKIKSFEDIINDFMDVLNKKKNKTDFKFNFFHQINECVKPKKKC